MKAWLARFAFWRRGRQSPEPAPETAEDPRAEELRRKLEESRTVAEEQHEQAAEPETPVDEVPEPEPQPPAEPTVDERRAAVHERARAAADEMRSE